MVKRSLFGAQYALERRLPIALQFVTFSPDQRDVLKKASSLPRHVETMMDAFERELTPEQQADPRFAFRVFMVHKTANRAPGADLAVELVPLGSDIAEKFNLALKEVEKRKYLPTEIVSIMVADGPTFSMPGLSERASITGIQRPREEKRSSSRRRAEQRNIGNCPTA
jgi:hypothetical protein